MAAFDEQAATTFLELTVGLVLQSQWAAGSEEEDLQECLNHMIPQILTCYSLGGNRTYHDTHGTLLDCGIPLCLVMLLVSRLLHLLCLFATQLC